MTPKLLEALNETHRKSCKKDSGKADTKRILAKQDSQAEAKKLAGAKLKSVSDAQLLVCKKDGITMLEEIQQARREAKARNGRVSCSFWAALKLKWGVTDLGEQALACSEEENQNMTVGPSLVSAMRAATD